MKCLITGGSGFIATYLAEYLSAEGESVFSVHRQWDDGGTNRNSAIRHLECDCLNREAVFALIREIKPDFVFHTAAQSLIMPSWQNPQETFRVNVLGTINVLDAIRDAEIQPVIEVFGSSGEYQARRDGRPIKEEDPLGAASPYAVSKIAQNYLCLLYQKQYSMKIVRVRPFFVIGPGKKNDVCGDFARKIVQIERGGKPVIHVGNLEAVRDFLDVRDAVKALWIVAKSGKAGDVFNICAGKGISVGDVLGLFMKIASVKAEIVRDPALMRPLDEPVKVGDNSNLKKLGWKPMIPIEKTLSDILNDSRERLNKKD